MATEKPDDIDLSGIYQTGLAGSFGEVATKEFKPWHKPRKYHIRIHQWCGLIAKLIRELRMGALKRPLKYLGMPGEDFLDVRTLEGVCKGRGVKLHYLGFDSTHPVSGATTADGAESAGDCSEFYLSRHEVYQLGFLDQMSKVVRRRIEEAAQEKSTVFADVAKHGPFDVVNIDLCDSVAIGQRGYFEAIKRLCDYQTRNRAHPWLLFVATRVDRKQIDGDIKKGLLGCIIGNAEGNERFTTALADLKLSSQSLKDEASGNGELDDKVLFDSFVLGIGKWLLQLMFVGQEPRVAVVMQKSYSYRVYGSKVDMISLAFRIEPIVTARVDGSGVTGGGAPAVVGVPSEGDLAIDLVSKVKDVVDVDVLLAENPSLRDKAAEKTKVLLKMARYPVDQYDEWAKTKTPELSDRQELSPGLATDASGVSTDGTVLVVPLPDTSAPGDASRVPGCATTEGAPGL